MNIIKNFISKKDVSIVQKYIKDIGFHTKDSHVPLHNDLYEKYNAQFDLHTRGEMPKHILDIFSKYSKGFYEAVLDLGDKDYMPPMFSKHYIARYVSGKEVQPQFDSSRPDGTYKSIIFWNDAFTGGDLVFSNLGFSIKPEPGDLVFFIESEINKVGISKIEGGDLFLSEAWLGKPGQLWIASSTPYEEIEWDNWEIRGF